MLETAKQLFTIFLQKFGTQWWAEITTATPQCIYYFGPFETSSEAKNACPSYVDDLDSEGAQGIFIIIKRCKPNVLTIFDE